MGDPIEAKEPVKQTTGVYQDLGVLGTEMDALKAMGDPAKLDETNELMILRAFASKLLKCLGAELSKQTFVAYLMREHGENHMNAVNTWNRFEQSGFLEVVEGYVRSEFIDRNTSGQLVKVLSEIRGIIKQIEEGNRKDSKHIKLEDMGEFALNINQHVEKMLLKIGGKQDIVHEWRNWFQSELKDFQSRNAKGGK